MSIQIIDGKNLINAFTVIYNKCLADSCFKDKVIKVVCIHGDCDIKRSFEVLCNQISAFNVIEYNIRYKENYELLFNDYKVSGLGVGVMQAITTLEYVRYQLESDYTKIYRRILTELIHILCCDYVHSLDSYKAANWG